MLRIVRCRRAIVLLQFGGDALAALTALDEDGIRNDDAGVY